MEDEEGYMALNMRPRKEQRQNPGSQELETLPRHHRWRRIVAGVGCAVILLIVGAALALRICAFQTRRYMDALEKSFVSRELTSGTENKSNVENVITRFRQFLCKPVHISVTESFRCKLCPENWFRHENKCYWISKEQGTWRKSQDDCNARDSQMLVIQKQEEVVNPYSYNNFNIALSSQLHCLQTFIQSVIEETQLLWIGLTATFPEKKWIWVDGSPPDEKRLQELGPVEANSCGMLNGHKAIAEACSTVAMWVCETEALDISTN
ncbi:killer cell lectin-like receptor subfamily B member 1B allele A [Elgaria multicarinata webbii]|uniref:killer cell lectin-like receptor subfamily B member 1B allele A n=1 Tax=Elgaria multicarinata webbii TaxID=159646 RepID=UPI002FCCC917